MTGAAPLPAPGAGRGGGSAAAEETALPAPLPAACPRRAGEPAPPAGAPLKKLSVLLRGLLRLAEVSLLAGAGGILLPSASGGGAPRDRAAARLPREEGGCSGRRGRCEARPEQLSRL